MNEYNEINKTIEIERDDKNKINSYLSQGKILDLGMINLNPDINRGNHRHYIPFFKQLMNVPTGMKNVLPATTVQLANVYKLNVSELETSMHLSTQKFKKEKFTPQMKENFKNILEKCNFYPSMLAWIWNTTPEEFLKEIYPDKSAEEINILLKNDEKGNELLMSLMMKIDNQNKIRRHSSLENYIKGDSLNIPFNGINQKNLGCYIPYIFNLMFFLNREEHHHKLYMPPTISDFAIKHKLEKTVLFEMLDRYCNAELSTYLSKENIKKLSSEEKNDLFIKLYNPIVNIKGDSRYNGRRGEKPAVVEALLEGFFEADISTPTISMILRIRENTIYNWKTAYLNKNNTAKSKEKKEVTETKAVETEVVKAETKPVEVKPIETKVSASEPKHNPNILDDKFPVYLDIKELLNKLTELSNENSKLKAENTILAERCEARLTTIKQLTAIIESKI